MTDYGLCARRMRFIGVMLLGMFLDVFFRVVLVLYMCRGVSFFRVVLVLCMCRGVAFFGVVLVLYVR